MKLLFIPRGWYEQDASTFPKNKLSKKKKKETNIPRSYTFSPQTLHFPSNHLNQSLPSESLTRFELIRNSNRDVTLIKKADATTYTYTSLE